MTLVPPTRWPLALATYLGAGTAAGFVTPDLSVALKAQGVHPGLAIAAVVNLVLPVLALLVTAWYPRRRTAALGGLLTYGGFALGETLRQTPRFWQWTWGTAASLSHPVLVVGAVVVALLGVGLAQGLRSWRRVGVPHDPGACPACGYQRGVLAVCPECGASGPGSPL